MKYVWETKKQPKLLYVAVKSAIPQEIIISVEDVSIPNTFYSYQQTMVPKGIGVFEISLPVTPEKTFFEIKTGAENALVLPWGGSQNVPTIQFDVKEVPFQQKWDCALIDNNPQLGEFMKFASWFSQNKNILNASFDLSKATYNSGGHTNFKFSYLPEIIDDQPVVVVGGVTIKNPNYGQPLPTSFRVHTQTKEMQVAKRYVVNYTYPQCMVLFAHEFSHGWLNKNPDDEFEADKNSLIICRCLGFSKREIGDAYAQVFLRYPSDQNVMRINEIKKTLESMN